MKITKADFPEFVDFTINLEDRLINPFIDKAFARDVTPKIGEALADMILAFDGVEVPAAPTNPVLDQENDTFDFDLVEITTEDPELAKLYAAVRPYWVLAAHHRHLLVHGIFHTPAGLTTPTTNTADQITDKRRAEVLAMVASDMNFYEGEMMKYAKANYPEEFKAEPCGTGRSKNRIGIHVVKSRGCKACGRNSCNRTCLR